MGNLAEAIYYCSRYLPTTYHLPPKYGRYLNHLDQTTSRDILRSHLPQVPTHPGEPGRESTLPGAQAKICPCPGASGAL